MILLTSLVKVLFLPLGCSYLLYLLEVYITSSVFGSVQKIWFINL